MRNPLLRFAAKLFLSALLLGLVLQSIEPSAIWETVRQSDVKLMVLAILLFYPIQLLAAYRWRYVLKQMQRCLPFRSVARHHMLGQFSALFLPGQLSGDVVRTVSIASGQRGKLTFALSVMIDKAALLAAIAFVALVGILGSKVLPNSSAILPVALGLLTITILSTCFLCWYRPRHNPNWLANLSSKLPAPLSLPSSVTSMLRI